MNNAGAVPGYARPDRGVSTRNALSPPQSLRTDDSANADVNGEIHLNLDADRHTEPPSCVNGVVPHDHHQSEPVASGDGTVPMPFYHDVLPYIYWSRLFSISSIHGARRPSPGD